MKGIRELPKNEEGNKYKHTNEPANIWLRDYLKYINAPGYGKLGISNAEFAKSCNMSKEKLEGQASGKYPIYATDIIKFVKETGVTANEILGLEEIPDDLKATMNTGPKKDIIATIDIFPKKAFNVINRHINKKGFFPSRDFFLEFLGYLICDEKFINDLSLQAKNSLESLKKDIEDNKLSDEEIKILATCKNNKELKTKIKFNNELKERLNNIIKKNKAESSATDIIIKYISDNLK